MGVIAIEQKCKRASVMAESRTEQSRAMRARETVLQVMLDVMICAVGACMGRA